LIYFDLEVLGTLPKVTFGRCEPHLLTQLLTDYYNLWHSVKLGRVVWSEEFRYLAPKVPQLTP